jgi:hypothetical protein
MRENSSALANLAKTCSVRHNEEEKEVEEEEIKKKKMEG